MTQTVYDPQTGNTIAWVEYILALEVTTQYDSLSWQYDSEFYFEAAGGAYSSMGLAPNLECIGFPCDLIYDGHTGDPFTSVSTLEADGRASYDFLGESRTDFAQMNVPIEEDEPTSFSVGVVYPNTPTGTPLVIIEYSMRCDNTARVDRFPGCVFTSSFPLFAPSETYESSQHIADAQEAVAPGADVPLHRTRDPQTINANRNTACPASFPTGPGQQCDEYPFATTEEGAASGGIHSARAISGPDNASAGAQLGNFYADERVLDGDAFYVAPSASGCPPVCAS